MAKENSGQQDAPARNSAERTAKGESMAEEAMTGKSAVPSEKPDWAKDLPDPKDSGKDKD